MVSYEYMIDTTPNCHNCVKHLNVSAVCSAFLSAGSRMLISSAMMPMTTNSSTNVNAGVNAL